MPARHVSIQPGSFLAAFVFVLLGAAHLARVIWGVSIVVDGNPVSMEVSIVASIVLGLPGVLLLLTIPRRQFPTCALFLAMPLLAFIAIAHVLRLVFQISITVGGVSIPMWASLIACVVPGLIVLMLWRESRKSDILSPDQEEPAQPGLFGLLMTPWIDRTIAIIAALPFAYVMVAIIKRGELNIPLAVIVVNHLVIVATMVLRTAPVRVTPNPWYWLLAFVATYGGLYAPALARTGTALVPNGVTDSLSLLALTVLLAARLSLGRSIGFVPAQRIIVTTGAYRFVRHPIYTGIFVSFLSWTLRSYSLRSVAISLIWCTLFIVKSFIEESFLREDPEYTEYLARVRWRWFPGLA
jgi:protein-S-isoprenylcysteine O-methyltransferase Ste14